MLKTLGRSVYLTQFEEQRASLSAFAAGGAPVFISLHISEEFDAAYCARVQEMCDFLSAQGWRILADVSEKTIRQFGCADLTALAKRLHLYPAAVFGAKPLYPPAAPRTEAPLAPVRTEPLDPDRLRQEQQLLLDYARLAVTEENVALLARQALAARGQVNASTLVEEYPNDFTGIIGLHTYSQSPHREYDITLTGNWVERGGFRFQDFVLTRRKEVNTDGNH